MLLGFSACTRDVFTQERITNPYIFTFCAELFCCWKNVLLWTSLDPSLNPGSDANGMKVYAAMLCWTFWTRGWSSFCSDVSFTKTLHKAQRWWDFFAQFGSSLAQNLESLREYFCLVVKTFKALFLPNAFILAKKDGSPCLAMFACRLLVSLVKLLSITTNKRKRKMKLRTAMKSMPIWVRENVKCCVRFHSNEQTYTSVFCGNREGCIPKALSTDQLEHTLGEVVLILGYNCPRGNWIRQTSCLRCLKFLCLSGIENNLQKTAKHLCAMFKASNDLDGPTFSIAFFSLARKKLRVRCNLIGIEWVVLNTRFINGMAQFHSCVASLETYEARQLWNRFSSGRTPNLHGLPWKVLCTILTCITSFWNNFQSNLVFPVDSII